MRRREFTALVGSVAAWPPGTRSQQRAVPVVGILIIDIEVRLLANGLVNARANRVLACRAFWKASAKAN